MSPLPQSADSHTLTPPRGRCRAIRRRFRANLALGALGLAGLAATVARLGLDAL